MKIYYRFLAGLLALLIIQTSVVWSQESTDEEKQPPILVVTKAHWNYDLEEGSSEDWLAIEKEYFDKVTAKNEFILGTAVLIHMFTDDNSEVLFVRSYKTWNDIEKASERDNELAKEAWADQDERSAFFKKQGKYYSSMHSDEMYQAIEGAKFIDGEEEQDKPLVYYMQVRHLAFPEDSKPGEIQELYGEYTEHVIHKNPHILAYYPQTHLYGADSRDFVEVFVVKSLADLEKALNNKDLIEAHWADEDSRKEFFNKYSKYFTGWHADYIYSNVPELSK